jgi:DNA-binding NarL/FixJ family response regulator
MTYRPAPRHTAAPSRVRLLAPHPPSAPATAPKRSYERMDDRMTTPRVATSEVLEVDEMAEKTTASARTKVAIIEDHSMVAEGFARIVAAEQDLEFVGTAATLADAMRLIESASPEVVLMDYHLPDGDGSQATRDVLERFPNTKILMLSGGDSDDLLSKAMEAGCSGFLEKTRPAIDIVTSIRAVARGELVLRADDLAGLIGRIRDGASGEALTARELEVLHHLAKGESSEDIAGKLFVSVHTIRNHVQNLLIKLNAHSKLAAVATATRLGILGLDDLG